MSNLIAAGQVTVGDLVAVDFDNEADAMKFEKVDDVLPLQTMFRVAGVEPSADIGAHGTSAAFERLMPETILSR